MLLQRLSLLWRRFTPLEEAIFDAVRRALPTGAQPIFDAQVSAINRVQRLPHWNEIDFYRIRRGKPDWNDVPLFPCKDEMRLARVRFAVSGRTYTAELASISGHIFDLRIVPSPKPVSFQKWDAPPDVVLHDNPLRASTGTKRPEPLPSSWQRFLERHAGPARSDWLLHDADSAYRVALRDREYLVLAEREGHEYVLCTSESTTDELFHLDVDDHDEPKPLVGTLDALIRS